MKAHFMLWLVTACIALLLSLFIPRIDAAEPVAPVVSLLLATACRHTPDSRGFAWDHDGKLICLTPKAKS